MFTDCVAMREPNNKLSRGSGLSFCHCGRGEPTSAGFLKQCNLSLQSKSLSLLPQISVALTPLQRNFFVPPVELIRENHNCSKCRDPLTQMHSHPTSTLATYSRLGRGDRKSQSTKKFIRRRKRKEGGGGEEDNNRREGRMYLGGVVGRNQR